MTGYFDTMAHKIRVASDTELLALDEELVTECARATMRPGFPADLAEAIDRAILRWSTFANSGLSKAQWTGPSDVADDAEHRANLLRLECDLHTIFHVHAQRENWGDDPRVWMSSLLAEAEERREELAARERGLNPHWVREQERLRAEAGDV